MQTIEWRGGGTRRGWTIGRRGCWEGAGRRRENSLDNKRGVREGGRHAVAVWDGPCLVTSWECSMSLC
jgi:hypothetical protein